MLEPTCPTPPALSTLSTFPTPSGRDHTADVANETAPSRFTLLPQSILDHVLEFLSLHDRVVLERKICHPLSQRLQACAAADAAVMLTTNIWTAASLRAQLDGLPQSDLPAFGRARVMAGMLARVPELPTDERWSAIEAVLERLDTVSGALAPVMDALAAVLADLAAGLNPGPTQWARLAQAVASLPIAASARAIVAVLGRTAGPRSSPSSRQLAATLLPETLSPLSIARALPAAEQRKGTGQLLCGVMARADDEATFAAHWSALLAAAAGQIERDAAFAARVFCALLTLLPGGRTASAYYRSPPSAPTSLQHWRTVLGAAAALPGDAAFEVARSAVHTMQSAALDDPDCAAAATAAVLAHLQGSPMQIARQLQIRAELLPCLPPRQQAQAWRALWDQAEQHSLPSVAIALANILRLNPCDPVEGWRRVQNYCLNATAPTPAQRAALLWQASSQCAPGTAHAEALFDVASDLALRHHQFLPLVRWIYTDDDEPADRILSVIGKLPLVPQARAFAEWLPQRGWPDELLPRLLPLAQQLQSAGCWAELSELAAAWVVRCNDMVENGPKLLPSIPHAVLPQMAGDMLGVLETGVCASHTPKLLAGMAQLTCGLWLQSRAPELVDRAWDLIDRLDAQTVRSAMEMLYRLKQRPRGWPGDDTLLPSECWARPTLLRAAALVQARFTAAERRRWLPRLVEAEGRMGDFRPDVERGRFDAVRQAIWQIAATLPRDAIDSVYSRFAHWFKPAARDPQHLEAWLQASAKFAAGGPPRPDGSSFGPG
ncbi:hypothetical protein [Cupriavidus gilardii]|uniref:hypothetical protein n=1 Tax=Cupriavidus gilardii TaxID=82541 RepID=UPI001574BA3A|nr:hypothetical protein [Cupriavidus gilardii]NSX03476.1 hypothetical protein [Cupriavidus gilardii]